jgi:uncharacterized membrane-anchored protein YitT (DUF2179 family)
MSATFNERMAGTDGERPPVRSRSAAVVRVLKDTLLVSLGIFCVGFGIKGFLQSSHFIDGGVTGISMLLASALGWPIAVWIPLINLPFVVLGYRLVGPAFAIKSALAIAGLALCLAVVPYPDVTADNVLTAIFGGCFIGAGIGLAMRGGAVVDGTDIAAILVSNRTPLLKVSDVILILNVVIFLTAAFFLGLDSALYSVVTYFAAAKSINFMVYGIEEYTGITIVSEHSDEITRVLTEDLHRGVTLYRGKRGFGRGGERQEVDVVFTVATRLDLPAVLSEVSRVDPQAFVTQHRIDDAAGGMLKRRRLH